KPRERQKACRADPLNLLYTLYRSDPSPHLLKVMLAIRSLLAILCILVLGSAAQADWLIRVPTAKVRRLADEAARAEGLQPGRPLRHIPWTIYHEPHGEVSGRSARLKQRGLEI